MHPLPNIIITIHLSNPEIVTSTAPRSKVEVEVEAAGSYMHDDVHVSNPSLFLFVLLLYDLSEDVRRTALMLYTGGFDIC